MGFKSLLGVRNRPDPPLLDWDQLYNLKNQSDLRKDCRALCTRLGSKIPTHELESLVTLYCKRRELEYTTSNGWLNIMEVLLALPFDQNTLYNVFHAITTKYIPRSVLSFEFLRVRRKNRNNLIILGTQVQTPKSMIYSV